MDSIQVTRTFPFGTSSQVLAFSLCAAQLASDAEVNAEVRQSFGQVTVTLVGADAAGAYQRLVEELDRAAAAVREGLPRGLTRGGPRLGRRARVEAVVGGG